MAIFKNEKVNNPIFGGQGYALRLFITNKVGREYSPHYREEALDLIKGLRVPYEIENKNSVLVHIKGPHALFELERLKARLKTTPYINRGWLYTPSMRRGIFIIFN